MFYSLQYIQHLEQGLTEILSVMNALISSSDKVNTVLLSPSLGKRGRERWGPAQGPTVHPGCGASHNFLTCTQEGSGSRPTLQALGWSGVNIYM